MKGNIIWEFTTYSLELNAFKYTRGREPERFHA